MHKFPYSMRLNDGRIVEVPFDFLNPVSENIKVIRRRVRFTGPEVGINPKSVGRPKAVVIPLEVPKVPRKPEYSKSKDGLRVLPTGCHVFRFGPVWENTVLNGVATDFNKMRAQLHAMGVMDFNESKSMANKLILDTLQESLKDRVFTPWERVQIMRSEGDNLGLREYAIDAGLIDEFIGRSMDIKQLFLLIKDRLKYVLV